MTSIEFATLILENALPVSLWLSGSTVLAAIIYAFPRYEVTLIEDLAEKIMFIGVLLLVVFLGMLSAALLIKLFN